MFKAIIIGSTGATGKQLLSKLIDNENCELVTSIGRKPALNNQKNKKVRDVVLSSLSDLESTEKYWTGNDVFFNCIGTTRAIAGNAENFVDVEVGISNEAAKMAHRAKVPHVSLISAKGANANIWAKHWIYPLFYIKTIGQKEQSVLSKFSFKNISIFKPGMLLRLQKKQTWIENVSESRGAGLRVDTLALAMINDAEKCKSSAGKGTTKFFIGNDNIKKSIHNI